MAHARKLFVDRTSLSGVETSCCTIRCVSENRRRAERHPIGLRVEFDSGSGLTRDVSGLGAYFRTDVEFHEGDELTFVIVIPEAVNVQCRGTVARVERIDDVYGVGVTIDSYSLADRSEQGSDGASHLVIRELKKHHGAGANEN